MSIFKKHIDAMSAYTPPLEGRDPKAYTLLDFNERTVEVTESVRQALHRFIDSGRLQMYPSYGDLTRRIAEYCGVADDKVMITNGSDQGIELIIRAACNAGDEIIIPGPSFAMYSQVAKAEALTIIEPQYTRQGGYPLQQVLEAVTDKTRVIVVSNPNNPCGTLVAPEDVVRIAKAAPQAAILVDECYFEYSKTSVKDHLDECRNLLITRTFSKTWGLPSIRLGYILSHNDNIRALLNVRGPYDVNQFAVVAVLAALEDKATSLAYVDEVMGVSKPMLETYLQERGVDFWPSAANYLWTFPEQPELLNGALVAAHILVRPKADAAGRMGLRITLGTEAQTRALIEVLEGVLGG
ncbi:histidinol-phosphate transaminase [Pseudomaricurvus sp. HS19]|uniref:pyridoxal phosphate-dependent aminotransferase n=1 Tax=Pseudomaricurvus sp. HS19 TaxID=2692626 RepID=UPI00136D6AB2|nr:histidinol-phosphate transaminase [Pseudomaricurvus sp. HS19]MYM64581.1 aminotransferase class I/II-fold pyridoxal phosphate-dependent enzyme [Pseudomaricurvus sp. HS19]